MAITELFGSVSEVKVTTQKGAEYSEAGRTFVSQNLDQSLANKLGAPRVLLAEVFFKTEEDIQGIRALAKSVKDITLPPQILKPVVFADVKLDDGKTVKAAGYPLDGQLLSEIPDLPNHFSALAANTLLMNLVESVVSLPVESTSSIHGGISPERVIIPTSGSAAAVQLAGLGTRRLPESRSKIQELMKRDIDGLRAVGRVLPTSVAFAGECMPSKPGSKPSFLLSSLKSALKREGDNPLAHTTSLETSDFDPPAPISTTGLSAPSSSSHKDADDPLPENAITREETIEQPVELAEQIAEVHERENAMSEPSKLEPFHEQPEKSIVTEESHGSDKKGLKTLMTRRNLLIGGSGIGVILLGSFAVGAMNGNKSKDTSESSDIRSVSTLSGYSGLGSWTVPIAASAQVFAAEAGVLVVNGPKADVHSFAKPTGKTLIRSIELGGDLDLAFDTKIGEKAALVMQSGQKIFVFVDGMGTDGKLIEASVGEGARISGSGSSAAVLSGSSAAVLLGDGLVEFKQPGKGTYTPLAADTKGLISVDFDAPVLVTDRDGKKVSSSDLKSVADGWGVHSWIGAGHGKVVSLWAQDAYTQDSSAEVILAVHSVNDGSLLGQKQMILSDAAEKSSSGMIVRPLRVGQGGQTAVFGRFVISLFDGTLRDDLPADVVVKKIKGEVIVAEDKSGSPLIFTPSETHGVKFNGAIMAQVSAGLLIQRGNKLILLPSNQT